MAVQGPGLSPTSAKASEGPAVPMDPSTSPPVQASVVAHGPPLTKPPLATWVQAGQVPPPSKASSDCPGPCGHTCGSLRPPALHEHVYSRPASGADAGERNTCRGGADAAGPETYLEVSEGLLGRRGLDVAHCRGKDTDSRGTREFFIFSILFYFLLLSSFVLSLFHFYFFLIYFSFLFYFYSVIVLLSYHCGRKRCLI